jgi:hypothetical protein
MGEGTVVSTSGAAYLKYVESIFDCSTRRNELSGIVTVLSESSQQSSLMHDFDLLKFIVQGAVDANISDHAARRNMEMYFAKSMIP